MKCLLSLPFIACLASAAQLKGVLKKTDLPSSGKEWVTLDNGVEFQAGADIDPRLDHVRKLWSKNTQDGELFVDGTETYYDENSQAWRLLGFYVDCDHCADENNVNYNQAYCIQEGAQQTCQRFLMWAAVSNNVVYFPAK
jgi:hypothetical protein